MQCRAFLPEKLVERIEEDGSLDLLTEWFMFLDWLTEHRKAQAIRAQIVRFLEANAPATLTAILNDVQVSLNIAPQRLLPKVMLALVELQQDGTIWEYHQPTIVNPLEYAWMSEIDVPTISEKQKLPQAMGSGK